MRQVARRTIVSANAGVAVNAFIGLTGKNQPRVGNMLAWVRAVIEWLPAK
jgi:hypothetical protein